MYKIKKIITTFARNLAQHRVTILVTLALVGMLTFLYTSELIALTNGLSSAEKDIASTTIGWRGILDNPFFLPLKLILSAGFFWFDQGGALVSRLPSVVFGVISVLSLTAIVKFWHGLRIALFTGLLFATSAWTLHVSRYASVDSSYLLAVPVLIGTILLLQRFKQWYVPVIVLFIWSLLLFTPGLIWLILLTAAWERYSFYDAWQQSKSWVKRLLMPLSFILLLPLLIKHLTTSETILLNWLGLPLNFGALSDFGTRLLEVPMNLFVVGPNNPELWLGRLPLLDVITIVFTLLGIVYYVKRWRAGRSQLLAGFTGLTWLIIGLGGPAGLSLILPVIYLLAGSGIAQLNNEWLKRFPNNPVARSFSTVMIVIAISVSCTYNLRNYFIAWPNNPATINKF